MDHLQHPQNRRRGGNLEFCNILVLNILSGWLLFVTLGWLCFETWSETGKLLFGNILRFVAASEGEAL